MFRVRIRPLLITGFSGVAASQLALALCFLLPESTIRSYIVLAAMVLFVAFVQCGIGIGVWLLLSEIFPMAIRGFAMGIAVFVLWVTNTVISFVFPLLNAALGPTWTFGLFVLINLGSVAFVATFVPETRGRTLEELEDDIREHDDRHLSHAPPADRARVVTLIGPGGVGKSSLALHTVRAQGHPDGVTAALVHPPASTVRRLAPCDTPRISRSLTPLPSAGMIGAVASRPGGGMGRPRIRRDCAQLNLRMETAERDRIRKAIPKGSLNAVAIQLLLDYAQTIEARADRPPREDSAA